MKSSSIDKPISPKMRNKNLYQEKNPVSSFEMKLQRIGSFWDAAVPILSRFLFLEFLLYHAQLHAAHFIRNNTNFHSVSSCAVDCLLLSFSLAIAVDSRRNRDLRWHNSGKKRKQKGRNIAADGFKKLLRLGGSSRYWDNFSIITSICPFNLD